MPKFHVADDVAVIPLLEALATQHLGFVDVPNVGLVLTPWPIAGKSVAERSRKNIRIMALEKLAAL